jgi:hypothetical protein
VVFCSNCGSSSRDMRGFCRGCGAPLTSAEAAVPSPQLDASVALPPAPKPSSLVPPIFQLDRLSRKNVWVAALFALLFGPPGMLYSTAVGALVMSVAFVLFRVFVGGIVVWVVWPVCIFWAAMAARE